MYNVMDGINVTCTFNPNFMHGFITFSENRSSGFLTRSDTNRAVQPQNGKRLEISDLGSRGIVLSK